MMLSKLAAGVIAFAVFVAVMLVAPARINTNVDIGSYGVTCPGILSDRHPNDECSSSAPFTHLTWGWLAGNRDKSESGVAPNVYHIWPVDMFLDIFGAVILSGVVYMILTRMRRGHTQ